MAKLANKTQATGGDVEAFLATVEPLTRREDARALCALMAGAAGEPPRMWGPAIVGFGLRRYRYESGREGETLKVGFSPRKAALTIYGLGLEENGAAVQALGRVSTGKGCVYLRSLDGIDTAALAALVSQRMTAPDI